MTEFNSYNKGFIIKNNKTKEEKILVDFEEVEKNRKGFIKKLKEKRGNVLNMRQDTVDKLRKAIINYFNEEDKLIGANLR